MPTYADVLTLHRYYIWANKFRTSFDNTIEAAANPHSNALIWFAEEGGMFLSYWYAALYVVIEGWAELGLHDAEVDALLVSPNVGYLKRYRNGVCHFQPEYLDERFLEMMRSPDSVEWVRSLNRAFGGFFLQTAGRPT